MKQHEKEQQGQTPQANRKYRDTVFRMLFGDRKNLLGLYNAVSKSSCEDPKELKTVTLENAVYMGHKNDLAFLAGLRLNLYEHQTTINFNMPFRFLQYVSEEYARLAAGENIYGSRRIPLPEPYFIVFYNGSRPFPERQVMRLSDAFPKGIECPLGEAVDRAVDECIKEGILKDFLLANKAEVKNMSIYEFDEEAYERAIRAEEYERGMEDGIGKGIKRGRKEGVKQEIIEMGLDYGLPEADILERLQVKLNVSRQKAQEYFADFSKKS